MKRIRSTFRHWRLWAIAFGLAYCSLALSAQESPSFFIETITVENSKRFSASIVVAESLLETGRSYSESELRDAVHRIVRLPLILDAQFSLRKGTERDRYALVIAVEEARRWFFGAELATEGGDDRRRPFESLFGSRTTALDDREDGVVFGGFRLAAGTHGVASVAFEPSWTQSDSQRQGGKLQFGYTQYNLFDRSIQLNLQYRYEPLFQDSSSDDKIHTFWLALGIPLWGNHSLSFESSYLSADRRTDIGASFGSLEDERESWRADLSWIMNSLDDPVFPTFGSFLRTGLEISQEDIVERRLIADSTAPNAQIFEGDRSATRAYLSADRYWRWHQKDSFSVSLDLSLGTADFVSSYEGIEGLLQDSDSDIWDAQLTLGYARFVYRDTKKPRWRELRWENELDLFDGDFGSSQGLPEFPSRGITLRTGLKYRTSWGVFGFSFAYTHLDGAP